MNKPDVIKTETKKGAVNSDMPFLRLKMNLGPHDRTC